MRVPVALDSDKTPWERYHDGIIHKERRLHVVPTPRPIGQAFRRVVRVHHAPIQARYCFALWSGGFQLNASPVEV